LAAARGAVVRQIRWNPEWETGYPLIDEQHRQLLGEFNEFITASHQDMHGQHVANLLEFLVDFLDSHCEEEEHQMLATKYARYTEHKLFHDGLRRKVRDLAETFRKDPGAVEAATIDLVLDWMDNHINVEDKLMARHLLAHGRKGAVRG
jgi:hemerythrin